MVAKTLLLIATALVISTPAFAKAPAFTGRVFLERTPNHTGEKTYEVIIEGRAAEELYQTLQGTRSVVPSNEGVWLNRYKNGVLCGQLEGTRRFSCAITVSPQGVQL